MTRRDMSRHFEEGHAGLLLSTTGMRLLGYIPCIPQSPASTKEPDHEPDTPQRQPP